MPQNIESSKVLEVNETNDSKTTKNLTTAIHFHRNLLHHNDNQTVSANKHPPKGNSGGNLKRDRSLDALDVRKHHKSGSQEGHPRRLSHLTDNI